MQSIEEVTWLRFIAAITGRYKCFVYERNLFVLPMEFVELGLLEYSEAQNFEYENSRKDPKYHTELLTLHKKTTKNFKN